ncbi:MAG: 16S rRNA (uracil(1498)-N(3))-methyltransferase [Gemmatimonadales bacterium]|nr:16S rRNA (uracil(1498)-N(3))-methyltransferase [Gemmatimonadales bacterium]
MLLPPGTVRAHQAIPISPEELRHLRVRRAEDGEAVRVCDGHGAVAEGRLEYVGQSAVVHLGENEDVPAPTPLILAVGAGDRERFGWLVEKAAELGVTEIVPLDTVRARDASTRLRTGQVERLTRRAREALKQCAGAWAPVVHSPVPLETFLAGARPGQKWVADRAGPWPTGVLIDAPITVAVGPEGGFTADERDGLAAAGYRPMRLAASVLRFETAALVAAAHMSMQRRRGHDE